MTEIKPGHKLDSAVTKAIGLKNTCFGKDCVLITSSDWDEMRGIEHLTTEGPIACKRFAPSTDLNAAFAAAEKVGLFHPLENTYGEGPWVTLTRDPLRWSIWMWKGEMFIAMGEAPTPALVICAAILKFPEEKEASMTD